MGDPIAFTLPFQSSRGKALSLGCLSPSSRNPRTCLARMGCLHCSRQCCAAHPSCHASLVSGAALPTSRKGEALPAPAPATFQLGKVTRKRQGPTRAHTACAVSSLVIFKSKCHSCQRAERLSSVILPAHPLECEIHSSRPCSLPWSWRRGWGRRSLHPTPCCLGLGQLVIGMGEEGKGGEGSQIVQNPPGL